MFGKKLYNYIFVREYVKPCPAVGDLVFVHCGMDQQYQCKGGVHVSLSGATITNKKVSVQIDSKFTAFYLEYCAFMTKK